MESLFQNPTLEEDSFTDKFLEIYTEIDNQVSILL